MKKSILIAVMALFFTAAQAQPTQPRSEYPRPQFERADWQCLNGTWTCELDFGQSGMENKLYESKGFGRNITVPFCPESELSGIGHKDFIPAIWYHRTLSIPQAWDGQHILLHFAGVDYRTKVFIDGKEVFEHFGGAASWAVDISRYVKAGNSHQLVVYAQDDVRSRLQPGGKQSRRLHSYECFYTRVTGIWAPVWMEPVQKNGLKNVRITPDLDNSQFVFEPEFLETDAEATFTVTVKDGQKVVGSKTVRASNSAYVAVPVKKVKTWSPETPFLYDVEYTVSGAEGNIIDNVRAYAGMRKVELRQGVFYLNNEPYYQRLVLDQGYYPDGQWTAPTDEALKQDIVLADISIDMAFDRVREERLIYAALDQEKQDPFGAAGRRSHRNKKSHHKRAVHKVRRYLLGGKNRQPVSIPDQGNQVLHGNILVSHHPGKKGKLHGGG